MNDEIKQIFSIKSIPIMIASAGFLSAIITMFVDVNQTLSIKWLVFLTWLLITLVCILSKIIVDLNGVERNRELKTCETPINILPNTQILIIRKNSLFSHNSVVGCYWEEDGVETLTHVGVVHHIQEKITQIKILKELDSTDSSSKLSIEKLSQLIIRPVIPYHIIQQISGDQE